MRIARPLPLILALCLATSATARAPGVTRPAPTATPASGHIEVPLFLGAFSVLFATRPDRAAPAARVALAVGPALLLELVVARWAPLTPEEAGPSVMPADLGDLGLRLADLLGIRIPTASLDPEAERRTRRRARFR